MEVWPLHRKRTDFLFLKDVKLDINLYGSRYWAYRIMFTQDWYALSALNTPKGGHALILVSFIFSNLTISPI